MQRILFVGGGSVGHIAPAVAVWQALQTMGDYEAHFVCSPRPDDAAFLEKNNLPYTIFDAPRLNWKFPFLFPGALHTAKDIWREHKPALIFSKGGYVSVPMAFAGYRSKIMLHESDAVSGRANRVVSTLADVVCLGMGEATRQKEVFTGNPVRPEVAQGSKEEGLRITGFTGKKPILIVLGGSQGATSINEMIATTLQDLLEYCDVIHLTGRGKQVITTETPGYYSTEFAFAELPHLYACSSLAISRAGAGSIAELAAAKLPGILVPLRNVGHDHQYSNAINAADSGGFLHLEQDLLDATLLEMINELTNNESCLVEMRESIAALYHPDAALQIAKTIVSTLASNSEEQ